MIQSIQKVIKVGSSGAVTIPAKQMKHFNIKYGDKVEFTVRPVTETVTDKKVVNSAKKLLNKYKADFIELSQR